MVRFETWIGHHITLSHSSRESVLLISIVFLNLLSPKIFYRILMYLIIFIPSTVTGEFVACRRALYRSKIVINDLYAHYSDAPMRRMSSVGQFGTLTNPNSA